VTRHVVPADADDRRADVAVAAMLDLSRSRAAGLFTDGGVRRDGRALRRSDVVRPGDVIEVALPTDDEPTGPAPALPPVRWQDEHLLVVAKPPGLVVHPGAGHADGTLVDALRAAGVPLAPRGGTERPGIVHRLDKDTSGLLVVASTDEAHAGLVDALRRRDVERRYLALAEGTLPSTTGRVDAPIGRDPADRKRFAAIQSGKPAVTHWQVRATGRAGTQVVSLLACRLETGRTHQIRVHLAFAGAPVVGDRRYWASAAVAATLGLARPFLHAATLGFTHPVTGEPVRVVEPLPDDLAAAATAAGFDPSATDPA
jgi:23S rRNA pseudouridine1911/1915/1917 synthase